MQDYWHKCAHKMLVKLTSAFSFDDKSQTCQLGSKLGISIAQENAPPIEAKTLFANAEGKFCITFKSLFAASFLTGNFFNSFSIFLFQVIFSKYFFNKLNRKENIV